MVDFYPVLDVNNNPRNPIINIRSFGEDVGLVSEMGRAFIKGIQAGGMLATAKHFPGHGDTNVDTHLGLAVIEHPREHLDKVELPPFRMAVEEGVDAFMSTHIILPALDPSPGVPATLSRPILTGLLRGEMKFDGLIFTDAMDMYAISKNFGNAQAAMMAVKAGVDFVLVMPDPDAAFAAIKAAVQSGEIPRGAGERVGGTNPAGEGAAGPAPQPPGGHPGDCDEVRRPGEPGCSRRDLRARHHAAEGRAEPGAAEGAEGRASPLPVGHRLCERVARGRRPAGRSSPR